MEDRARQSQVRPSLLAARRIDQRAFEPAGASRWRRRVRSAKLQDTWPTEEVTAVLCEGFRRTLRPQPCPSSTPKRRLQRSARGRCGGLGARVRSSQHSGRRRRPGSLTPRPRRRGRAPFHDPSVVSDRRVGAPGSSGIELVVPTTSRANAAPPRAYYDDYYTIRRGPKMRDCRCENVQSAKGRVPSMPPPHLGVRRGAHAEV